MASCPFNFHRADIKDNEFYTVAKCEKCSSTINMKSMYTRSELQLEFHKTAGEKKCDGFRRVTAHKAIILSKEMQKKTTYEVFHEQSKSIRDDAETLPPDFVSQKSLSNIKSRHNLVEGTAIHNLRCLKYTSNGSIKELATDPFVVIFWTQQQIHCYSQTSNQCVSLDATGGVIKSDFHIH